MALGFPALASAGTELAPMEPAAEKNSGDWCEWWSNKPGKFYSNKENPFIQEVQIEGRLQWQTASVDGNSISSGEFDDTYTEFRRARLGVKAKFLKYFGLKYQINAVGDSRPSSTGQGVDWGYQDIDEAYITFDLAKAFSLSDFDDLKLVYGRQKYVLGHEADLSSNNILTVERSAISNKIYGSYRPTGLTLKGESRGYDFSSSLYSSSGSDTSGFGASSDEFSDWTDSFVFLNRLGYQVSDKLRVYGDFVYNFAELDGSEDSFLEYEWGGTFGAQYNSDAWGIDTEFVYGDNGDQSNANRRGMFYGAIFTPYYWIMKEKLQFVTQYQYAGAEESEGIRINSRYGRREGSFDINSGRGDSHHSLYAGLNYFLCGHNAKVQAGVEYQTMDTPTGDFDTTSYLLSLRAYF